jgi:hypothetical protein
MREIVMHLSFSVSKSEQWRRGLFFVAVGDLSFLVSCPTLASSAHESSVLLVSNPSSPHSCSRNNKVVLLRDTELSKEHCKLWRDVRGDLWIQVL